MGHNSTAKAVRLQKEKTPSLFCPAPKCLYRTKGNYTPCPKHEDFYDNTREYGAPYVEPELKQNG